MGEKEVCKHGVLVRIQDILDVVHLYVEEFPPACLSPLARPGRCTFTRDASLGTGGGSGCPNQTPRLLEVSPAQSALAPG